MFGTQVIPCHFTYCGFLKINFKIISKIAIKFCYLQQCFFCFFLLYYRDKKLVMIDNIADSMKHELEDSIGVGLSKFYNVERRKDDSVLKDVGKDS